jgi:hypothetical protein
MGGGGTIIIRDALKTTLTNPVVSGSLPPDEAASIAPFIETDVNTWTTEQQHLAAKAFFWVAVNC